MLTLQYACSTPNPKKTEYIPLPIEEIESDAKEELTVILIEKNLKMIDEEDYIDPEQANIDKKN